MVATFDILTTLKHINNASCFEDLFETFPMTYKLTILIYNEKDMEFWNLVEEKKICFRRENECSEHFGLFDV